MKKSAALILAILMLLTIAGCDRKEEAMESGSGKQESKLSGNIKAYSRPTHENSEPVSSESFDITEKKAKEIRKILDGVPEWTDDHTVDRLAYYFNGEFTLSDSEYVYYYTYHCGGEYIIYYNHYFAAISEEDMRKVLEPAGIDPAGDITFAPLLNIVVSPGNNNVIAYPSWVGWNYKHSDEEWVAISADSDHPLTNWENLEPVVIGDYENVVLCWEFPAMWADSIRVRFWDEGEWSYYDPAESAATEIDSENGGNAMILDVQPGKLYEIVATWEKEDYYGEAYYGFRTEA